MQNVSCKYLKNSSLPEELSKITGVKVVAITLNWNESEKFRFSSASICLRGNTEWLHWDIILRPGHVSHDQYDIYIFTFHVYRYR